MKTQTPLPTRLDFYRIGRTLGRGAFGKVSLCLHKLSHSLVAIKSIKKEAESDIKHRALVEMSLQQSCKDRNVIQIYDSFETPKHMCFVIELCSGGDLHSYVRKRVCLKESHAKYFFV